jgi:O-antigen/teichoic acid export membrane protein
MISFAKLLHNLKNPSSLGSDALYLAFENGTKLVIGFFVSILVVRYLGPEQFGIFSYLNVWISILTPLATLGLAGPLMRSLIHAPENSRQTLKTILFVRLAAALFVAALATGVFSSGVLLDKTQTSNQLIYIVTILSLQYIIQSFDVFETYNQATGRIKQTTRARLVAFLFVSGLRVVAVQVGAGLDIFAWLIVLQSLIGFLITYINIPNQNLLKAPAFNSTEAKTMIQMGAFIVLAGTINMAQARCEVYFLERYAGMQAVGLYSGALRFIELFDTLGTIAVTVYLPRLLASTTQAVAGDKALVSTYRAALTLYAGVIPLIIAMAGVAYLLLGSKFVGIHWLIISMGTRPLFTFLGLTRSMNMLAENKLRYDALCSSVGFFISAASAAILIPVIGVYGAAASAFLGYLCSNILIDAFLNKRYFFAFAKALSFK